MIRFYLLTPIVTETMANIGDKKKDAFIGCLLGLAVGDALGFIVEGYDGKVCKRYVDVIIKKRVCPVMTRLPQFTFGQYSDDTQLAREYLISVLQTKGKYEPAVYATRIAMLFMPDAYRIVGYGHQTAEAAEKVRKGAHHTESGSTTGHGNGSAMRSAPLGLIFSDLTEKEMDARVAELSAITHASQSCIDGSIAIARAARHAMTHADTPFEVMGFLRYVSEGTSESYRACLVTLAHMIEQKKDTSDAVRAIVAMGCGFGERDWGEAISVGVVQSSLWALWSVCKHPDSYVDCIAESILPGGDVDTTAAMAGGIIGARVTSKAIPHEWAERLHDLNEWVCADLVELASRVSKF